jgi:hypothetical protein
MPVYTCGPVSCGETDKYCLSVGEFNTSMKHTCWLIELSLTPLSWKWNCCSVDHFWSLIVQIRTCAHCLIIWICSAGTVIFFTTFAMLFVDPVYIKLWGVIRIRDVLKKIIFWVLSPSEGTLFLYSRNHLFIFRIAKTCKSFKISMLISFMNTVLSYRPCTVYVRN